MKTLYFATAGETDATRASLGLHLAANGSVEVGHETAVVLAGDATELLSEETANKLEGVGVPPVRELLAKLLEHGVPVYV
ncbi:MAG: DsrE family protein [Gaiellales bacterium]